MLYVVSIAPIVLTLQAQDGKAGWRPKPWPPPAVHRPVPLLRLTLKAVVKELCPSSSLAPHITRIPLHLWAWGRGYLRRKASNMATESKGLHACCTAGCWHLLPPSAPCFILEVPSPTHKPKRNPLSCFLSCLPLPKLGKQYSTKERKRTSCAFVRCAGQRCCLLLSAAQFLLLHTASFWWEKKKKLTSVFALY